MVSSFFPRIHAAFLQKVKEGCLSKWSSQADWYGEGELGKWWRGNWLSEMLACLHTGGNPHVPKGRCRLPQWGVKKNNCRLSKIPQKKSVYWILWTLTQKSLSVPGHTHLILGSSIFPGLRIMAQKKMFSEGWKISFSFVFYFITSGFPFNNSVRKP